MSNGEELDEGVTDAEILDRAEDVAESDDGCPFCGADPYHYVDVGVGSVPVAVVCCEHGIGLFQHHDEGLSNAAGKLSEAKYLISQLLRIIRASSPSAVDAAEVVGWQPGERALAFKWATKLLAKLSTKPDHADDCLWLVRLSDLFASPPPAFPSAPQGVDPVAALLDAYDAETKLLPLGHEMPTRGASTYNWRRSIVDELRILSAIQTSPEAGR